MLSNLSSINSVNTCLCQCYNNIICSTVTYFRTNQRCILYFAQFNQGQLQVAPISANASVYNFRSRSNNTVNSFKRTNETIYGIWNTTAGGNSVFSVPGTGPGNYYPGSPPKNAFDGNLSSEYASYGSCNTSFSALVCGAQTGFYLTMNSGPKILAAFYMATDVASWTRVRDPMLITIEGSNLNGSALTLGSSWTLIYNGSAGFVTDPGRSAWGTPQTLPNPSIRFASYRLLVVSKEGIDSPVAYTEVQFILTD